MISQVQKACIHLLITLRGEELYVNKNKVRKSNKSQMLYGDDKTSAAREKL